MSLYDRLRRGLRRTATHLAGRVDEVSAQSPDGAPDISTIEALAEILISSDVGLRATEQIVAAVARQSHAGRIKELVKAEMVRLLDPGNGVPTNGVPLRVVLVVGVNGAGKTTTVGKLAKRLKSAGERPLICAADTYRAAAVDQLDIWATRAEVGLVKARPGADPAAVVYDALVAARARNRSVVIVDTAGRLHTKLNLMAELDKIRRVASREVEGAPHEVLLVLDATVGQNGVVQASAFARAAGVSGVVLTKLDGTARGGVAVAIAADLGLPIRYVGVGEEVDDLLPFAAADFVDALFEERW